MREGKDIVPLQGAGPFGSFSNVAKFDKMVREVGRERVPPEIGPTVSVKEAMALLGVSRQYIEDRLEDGRLNAWKDPVSRRLHILLVDVESLRDANARSRNAATERTLAKAHRAPSEPAAGTGGPEEDEEDVEPFSWDDVCAAEVAARWERESQARYEARLAELMAELEDETGRQGEKETRRQATGGADEAGSEVASPLNTFPVGWIKTAEVAAMLDVNRVMLKGYVLAGKLERRRPTTNGPYLYDSAQVARFAEERLARSKPPRPNNSVRWWGSRSQKIELGDFDYWMTASEAAQMLGVTKQRVGELCRRGLLQCYQREPGKPGSRLYIPHSRVATLLRQPEHAERRRRSVESRNRTARPVEYEPWGIGPVDLRQPSANTRRDYGDYYTTRQVALLLGIKPQAVLVLRATGRLTGVRRGRRSRHPERGPGRMWWFYRKEDVHALQADPEYMRRSQKGKAGQRGSGR